MSDEGGFEGLDLTDHVVLLAVVELDGRDETPVHAGQVRRACLDALEEHDLDVVGRPAEAEVARSLNELEAAGILAGSRDDTSPTGKGRPGFELALDRATVLGELTDDRLEPLLSRAESSD